MKESLRNGQKLKCNRLELWHKDCVFVQKDLESNFKRYLVIESDAERNIAHKGRYVMGGHCDKLKHYILQEAQNLQLSCAWL